MRPYERTQADDRGDEYSDLTVQLNDDRMITRQEFKDEADINIILKRFGVQSGPMGTYGEVDYTIDLQQALAAIASANQAHFNVPPELQGKYRTWRDVLNAAETGEYRRDLDALRDQKAAEKAAAAAPNNVTVP